MFWNKNKNIGIYVHIPFCVKKCPYCDFYSVSSSADKKLEKLYVQAVIEEIKNYRKDVNQYKLNADTIYFGGGTPTSLTSEDIINILDTIRKTFIGKSNEITIEANPSSVTEDELKKLFKGGINRISFGVQSGNDDELYLLGRLHNVEGARIAVNQAKNVGFKNISIDLMLGLPYQTIDKIDRSLELVAQLDVQHVSAYLLKIEKGTMFDNESVKNQIPNEDRQVEIYLYVVDRLEKMGFHQYEISNFAKDGYESKHNLKYWNSEEYIGIGTAAHSYFKGQRYEQQRNIYKYIGMSSDKNFEYVMQSDGGVFNEYIMLKLRTNAGIKIAELTNKYPKIVIKEFMDNVEKYYDKNLIQMDDDRIRLTPEGFMIFNTIVSNIMVD